MADTGGDSDGFHSADDEPKIQTITREPVADSASGVGGDDGTVDESGSWGSWGAWGATTLSSAAQSMKGMAETVTTKVTENATKLQSTFEGVMLEPGEELPAEGMEATSGNDNLDIPDDVDVMGGHGLQQQITEDLSFLSKTLSDTGKSLVSGGMVMLENIGKKTVEVLDNTDPGLQNTKRMLNLNYPTALSESLREAAEAAAFVEHDEFEKVEMAKCTFEYWLDHYGAPASLEAISALSRQCQGTIPPLSSQTEAQQTVIRKLNDMAENCDLEIGYSEDALEASLAVFPGRAAMESHLRKFRETLGSVDYQLEALTEGDKKQIRPVFQACLGCLAKQTACSLEFLQKNIELLSAFGVPDGKEIVHMMEELIAVARAVCGETSKLTDTCGSHLKEFPDDEVRNDHVTSLYLESQQTVAFLLQVVNLSKYIFQSQVVKS